MAIDPDTFTESELQAERWLAVPGREGEYEVSDLGRVRSLDRVSTYTNRHGTFARRHCGLVLSPAVMKDGHLVVNLGRNGRTLVHHLVLQAFVGPAPSGHECCHGNGKPSDNRLGNLRWGTRADNVQDAISHGTHRGWAVKRRPAQVLSPEDIPLIRQALAAGEGPTSIGRRFGVGGTTIGQIKAGRNWGHIPAQQEMMT